MVDCHHQMPMRQPLQSSSTIWDAEVPLLSLPVMMGADHRRRLYAAAAAACDSMLMPSSGGGEAAASATVSTSCCCSMRRNDDATNTAKSADNRVADVQWVTFAAAVAAGYRDVCDAECCWPMLQPMKRATEGSE
jgi:hypothetical protein